MESNTGQIINLGSLYERLKGLKDKRKDKGKRYALATILVGMFMAKLCGEDQPSGIAEWVALRGTWMAQVLGLKRKSMPSHHTYRRALADNVDAKEFEALARAHHRQSGKAGYQVVVAMDGKILRGTIELETTDGLCLLAVYLPGEGITLAQLAIENKQNEVSAAPMLLSWIDLRNKVVIGDALHTQRQVSIQIGKAGGNYLWTVKGNHPQLLQDLQDWFDDKVPLLPGQGCPSKDFCSATITSKGHGRLEMRTLTTSSQLNDFLDWPFLQQVFKLERTITISKTKKTRQETGYGLTSLSADQASPAQLLHMLRSYWQIENSLHYPRDVTLHEDQTRFKHHAAAHNMAIINNLVLGLLAASSFSFIPSARRFFAAHPDQALALLL
ncbi:MAG TPA: ISAs1 family transposase [Anaerolineales bacterium]|nr:ISAs1 family transposase [Anaerolineales bacterium]